MSTSSGRTPKPDPDYRLRVVDGFEARVAAAGLTQSSGFDRLWARADRVAGGRSDHLFLAPDETGPGIRLRPLQHGGWLARPLADRFLGPERAFRELECWLALRAAGVPLPQPVLAVARRRRGFWRAAFGAIDQQGALDGEAWLATQPDAESLAACAQVFGRALRRLHEAGALHGDLHLRNVLIEAGADGPECLFVDLDRARLSGPPSPSQRMGELMRFARSLEKGGQAALLEPARGLPGLVLAAYCGGDRELETAMLDRLPAEHRRLRRHRLAWRLGRLFATGLATILLGAPLACSPADAEREAPGERAATRWSLLAVGDTGRTSALPRLFEGQLSVASAMAEEAERQPVDAIALLGDNFYWHGLDREHLVERLRANLVEPYCVFLGLDGPRAHEVEQACRVEPARRQPVPVYAVLGNHDFELPESARLQREAIPDFVPDWRMSQGLAQSYEVADGVSLVLFESEPAIRDPEAMKQALGRAIRQARGPWRILLTHRPIATDDLGGVPIGGYPIWVREGIAESGRPVQLVLAAHHHNLQAFELEHPSPLLQVGVGSGARATPPLAQGHPDALFGALELGFARVDVIGPAGDGTARLAVSIFAAPRWPWVQWLQSHRLRARFEVDLEGRVHATPAG